MNSLNENVNDVEPKSLSTEELTITIIYYVIAFLIFIASLIFINKRI